MTSPDDGDEDRDRRQFYRRDEDAVLYHRVENLEHNFVALSAGLTLAQLEKLDIRYQPRAEAIRTFVTEADLRRDYLDRAQLRNEYVPRDEHIRRFDTLRNLALVLIAFGALVASWMPLILHH